MRFVCDFSLKRIIDYFKPLLTEKTNLQLRNTIKKQLAADIAAGSKPVVDVNSKMWRQR